MARWAALGWYAAHILCAVANDAHTKYLSRTMRRTAILAWRFSLSAFLLGLVAVFTQETIWPMQWRLHVARAALMCGGIALWARFVSSVPLSISTIIGSQSAIMLQVIGWLLLKEDFRLIRLAACVGSLIGVIIAVEPWNERLELRGVVLGACAAFCFACMQALNRVGHAARRDSALVEAFWTSVGAAVLGVAGALHAEGRLDLPPAWGDRVLLGTLSVSANLVLYCSLRAFHLSDASALAPFAPMKMVVSTVVDRTVFGIAPTRWRAVGAAVSSASAVWLALGE